MSAYHEYRIAIENCRTEVELLKIVEDVMKNTKENKLDEVDIDKLEQLGMRKYEAMLRDRQMMFKNRK